AVGWQIYDLTHDPWDLGLVGLVQFVPSALLVLWTGAAADRFDRRVITMLCAAVEMIAVGVLLFLVFDGIGLLWPIYAALAVIGIARAFFAPASQALLPNLVPREDFASAIALSASAWQLSSIVGPVTGGLLYGISPLAA
ncbi:MFS transporter, partial [Enterococcus faecium]|uniref:MFS transporter n=1 Tax=Enterococcus faecium TaxID=1352 RepID=UPI003AABFA46